MVERKKDERPMYCGACVFGENPDDEQYDWCPTVTCFNCGKRHGEPKGFLCPHPMVSFNDWPEESLGVAHGRR